MARTLGSKNVNPYDARRVRFCPSGHDKDAVGRTTLRRCLECSRQDSRERNWRENGVVSESGETFTTTDYDRAYQIQQGRCVGCFRHQTQLSHTLAADHNHATGKFRALLCMNCNRALGMIGDAPETLERLAKMLRERT